jgi:CRP/FNR family transcriptional regulator
VVVTIARAVRLPAAAAAPPAARHRPAVLQLRGIASPGDRWRESLGLIEHHLSFTRRTVHAGEAVQAAGDPFACLHIVNSGAFKTVNLADDGREQVVGLHFKGDWIGFDGVASGRSACDAITMDTGEVWSLRYAALLKAAANAPELMHAMVMAMSCQLARDRDWRLALSTLPADARVADFLRSWAESLAERSLRTDQITLGMSRAEIGNHLGLTLETVSRAFSRLARCGLIRFDEKGRRTIAVPSVEALVEFVRSAVNPPALRALDWLRPVRPGGGA